MASGFEESTSRQPVSPPLSGSCNNDSDAGDFECNVCFDLAQDPIVTLCGHLFCWPCLYKWLHFHSRCQECPVCKALIEEEKLVPLYGRGKNSSDPRSKWIPGMGIPHRPTGQRPETAAPPNTNANANAAFVQQGHGLMGGFSPLGGFAPTATARFGNFTLSTALGGLFPSFFNIQVHGFPDPNLHAPGAGFPYGFSNTFYGGRAQAFRHRGNLQEQADSTLKFLLLAIGLGVLMTLIWS